MPAVIDASTLVTATLHADSDRRAAITRALLPHLYGRFKVFAPSHLAFEVANVVHGRLRKHFPKTPQDGAAIVQNLLADIEFVHPAAAAVERIGTLAEAHGLSAYDAAYLELASTDDSSILITEDAALLQAGRRVLGKQRTFNAAAASAAVTAGAL